MRWSVELSPDARSRLRRLVLLGLTGASALVSQSTRPVIREEQTVVVNGAIETWRLEWKTAPKPYCPPVEVPVCPCNGFGYGESGQLDLVRTRNGREGDR